MDKDKKYFIKQKLIGSLLVAACLILTIITKDATASVILIPLGLYAIFTKNKVMIF